MRQRALALGERRRGSGRDGRVLGPVSHLEDPGHLGEAAAPAAARIGREFSLDDARQDRLLVELFGDSSSSLR